MGWDEGRKKGEQDDESYSPYYLVVLLSDKSFSAEEESFISSDSRVPSLSDF